LEPPFRSNAPFQPHPPAIPARLARPGRRPEEACLRAPSAGAPSDHRARALRVPSLCVPGVDTAGLGRQDSLKTETFGRSAPKTRIGAYSFRAGWLYAPLFKGAVMNVTTSFQPHRARGGSLGAKTVSSAFEQPLRALAQPVALDLETVGES